LLEADCPEFAALPIRMVDEGWDNFTFLVGQRYAARFPRRKVAVPLLVNEQRWLPVLAPKLSLEVPVPVYVGQPSEMFPWPWSVVNWIQGATAETHFFHAADATLLAENLLELHQPAPAERQRIRFAECRSRPRVRFVKSG
jgi:aminoglycoside phosphotransferase (APT) family kinase protein